MTKALTEDGRGRASPGLGIEAASSGSNDLGLTAMEASFGQRVRRRITRRWESSRRMRNLFQSLRIVVIGYAFLAGLRTLTEYDLGWQLATGRWVVQHLQIPSTDVFYYTVAGTPWIYPVGSGLLFYGVFLIGGYQLLSWFHAFVCAGTVALLLRRGSTISAILAILAVPLIAIRTRPRADMFTVLIFAAFFVLLWRQYQGRRVRLWPLPMLMILWVNLHLGFAAGLALITAYVSAEAAEIASPERRAAAADRLRAASPWLVATVVATFVNPWGSGIYRALFRQESAISFQSQSITEWGPARLNWTSIVTGLSLRNPAGALYLMLLIAAMAILIGVLRRQLGAAALITIASVVAIRHIRFEALFAIVFVVVAGSVLTSALGALPARFKETRAALISGATLSAALFAAALACLRSVDLVDNRSYLASTDLGSFGAGLSWWFPAGAAAFIERENIPGQIFNSYNEGGYLTWRLAPKYLDYIDGRAIPFGPRLFERNARLMATPPTSSEWQQEVEHFDINAIVVPLGRYNGLNLFPVLRQFCANDAWTPVYLDEVSAVFVRRASQNQSLIQRSQVDCARASLPLVSPQGETTAAFNQWANAAALLHALGRSAEAFTATTRALTIFKDSAFVHFLRGNLFEEAGNLGEAEAEYRTSIALEENGTTWSRLAALYHREGRLTEEIAAWEQASEFLPYPAPELVSLGYAAVALREPQKALEAFDGALAACPRDLRRRMEMHFSPIWRTGVPWPGACWGISNGRYCPKKRQ